MREKEGREKLGLNSSHKSHLRNEACVRLVGEEVRERERLKLEEVEMEMEKAPKKQRMQWKSKM